MKLTTKILLGLILGAGLGVAVQASGSEAARSFVLMFEPLGTAFIRLISMVVVGFLMLLTAYLYHRFEKLWTARHAAAPVEQAAED